MSTARPDASRGDDSELDANNMHEGSGSTSATAASAPLHAPESTVYTADLPSTFGGFLWEVLIGSAPSSPASPEESTSGGQAVAGADGNVDGVDSSASMNATDSRGNPLTAGDNSTSVAEKVTATTGTTTTIDNTTATGNTRSTDTSTTHASSSSLAPSSLASAAVSSIYGGLGYLLGYSAPTAAESQTIATPALTIISRRPSPRPLTRPPITLVGRDDKLTQAPVLTAAMAEALRRQALPSRLRDLSEWRMIYSLEAHGSSLSTLYTNVRNHAEEMIGGTSPGAATDSATHVCPTVLAVRDDQGAVFGY